MTLIRFDVFYALLLRLLGYVWIENECECTMSNLLHKRVGSLKLRLKIRHIHRDLSISHVLKFVISTIFVSLGNKEFEMWICFMSNVKANLITDFSLFSLQEFLVVCDMDCFDSLSLYKQCCHIKSLIRSSHIDEASFSTSRCICRLCDLSNSSFGRIFQLSVDVRAGGRHNVVGSTNWIAALYQVQFCLSSECCAETTAWSWTILWLPSFCERHQRWNGTADMFNYSHKFYNANWLYFSKKDEHHYGVGGEEKLHAMQWIFIN